MGLKEEKKKKNKKSNKDRRSKGEVKKMLQW